ncbi:MULTISPECIES: uridine diphosphate-N-acetylglucosamine-binding protein YvcK [unclassified Fusibacter]|uniref:gluconeogenesis factor YvcK family protein n=1 Tax=unclassified Fusibacter TaxID=2624464 RepID=UPI00101237E1|nr:MULTISPECIES: uridine diphosphate-N-acetylglucosamine-binding protein YvcK [unclassified Fusibacter]MCK8061038.1 uridine diphosphate-N-acetylglucosamine-binding protein YvcK [Fusibacter sp. A2]NPE20508.1 uridine diphosphate-N-acetylglucosamine-binding protein YvcK [Fusibacter sp. A1]RXV63708.1 uridine diphosphate-N-acetylglucosamine-binding protein YvcK [Fusibacter sp. A1]
MKRYQTKVVVIGGGSGLSVVLRGLKHFTTDVTAIVTVADDGGSSGKLREDLGMLPPGDIRNCILALSNAEQVMQDLMQFRFSDGKLKGHSLGNMLIAGMVGMTGGMEEALTKIHEIFAVTGKVLPVSLDDIVLYAKLSNGLIVKGESKIPKMVSKYKASIERVFIEPHAVNALDASVKAILDADIIMIGPGSLYTSILPNLLIDDIQAALLRTKAKKVLAMNLMTQPGETDQMSLMDHVETIIEHTSIGIIDSILVNNEHVEFDVEQRYKSEGADMLRLTETDIAKLELIGVSVIEESLIEVKAGYIRHDADKLSERLLDLIDTVRYVK